MICDIVKNDKGDYCRSINHEQSIISGTLIDYCQMSKSFPEGIMVEAYNPDDTRLNKGIIYTKYLISIHKNGYSIGRSSEFIRVINRQNKVLNPRRPPK